MESGLWDKTVAVQSGRVLDYVRDTNAAARYLRNRWPDEHRDNQSYETARIACLEFLEGHMLGPHARKAFEAAAKDARIHVAGTRLLRTRPMSESRKTDTSDIIEFVMADDSETGI